jgi:hypothetical protein
MIGHGSDLTNFATELKTTLNKDEYREQISYEFENVDIHAVDSPLIVINRNIETNIPPVQLIFQKKFCCIDSLIQCLVSSETLNIPCWIVIKHGL